MTSCKDSLGCKGAEACVVHHLVRHETRALTNPRMTPPWTKEGFAHFLAGIVTNDLPACEQPTFTRRAIRAARAAAKKLFG